VKRAVFGDPVVAGLCGGIAVAVTEGAALVADGAGVELLAVAVALLFGLGLVVGGVLAACQWLIVRARLDDVFAAAVLAAPAIVPTSYVASSLFEGAFAATLPGAHSAWLWLPALVWVGLGVVVWLARRWRDQPWMAVVSVLVPTVVFAVAEGGNRFLFVSGYERVHEFLVVVSIAALAVLVGNLSPRSGRPHVAPFAVVATGASLAALGVALTVLYGLQGQASRADLAIKGNHVRHLVRIVRGLGDGDDDGFARWLGGGDCDDSNPNVNPGRVDTPGNGIDDDCQGGDATSIVTARAGLSRDRAYREWRQRPHVATRYQRTRAMNVLMISVDALRADEAFAGPALAALRDRSLWFARALAPGAGTDLSLSTVVTGRIDPFAAIDTTVLEAIDDSGRATVGILPREVLRYAGETLLTRGLDRKVVIVNDKAQRDVGGTTTSVETTDAALERLQQLAGQPEPFFLWVHYFDVHEHLQVENDDRHLREQGADLGTIAGKYRALVRLTDREIGRLLAGLDESGQRDDTIVVLFSDHGESLGEDPRLPDNHGLFVYQPLVAVPILLAIPGLEARRIDEPVALVDLSATLVELLGTERPKDLAGIDLAAFGDPSLEPPLTHRGAPIVLNESEQWGVVEWPYKLLVRPADNLVELYDLERDPEEKDNVATQKPDLVDRLKSLYASVPRPNLDRTRKARRERDRLAQPPAHRRK